MAWERWMVERDTKLVADRVAGLEYHDLAKKYGIAYHTVRGICKRAYKRGEVTAEQLRVPQHFGKKRGPVVPVIDRIMKKIRKDPSGCWIWTGSVDGFDYGSVFLDGKVRRPHRLVYEHYKGPIPPRHYICHTCDIPRCCNPEHLWAGMSRENLLDCVRKGRHQEANQTHCKRGHPLSGENMRRHGPHKNKRTCVICQRGHQRIRNGWPSDLAYNLPASQRGIRVIGKHFKNMTWCR